MGKMGKLQNQEKSFAAVRGQSRYALGDILWVYGFY
jgi:hypothetical protein